MSPSSLLNVDNSISASAYTNRILSEYILYLMTTKDNSVSTKDTLYTLEETVNTYKQQVRKLKDMNDRLDELITSVNNDVQKDF